MVYDVSILKKPNENERIKINVNWVGLCKHEKVHKKYRLTGIERINLGNNLMGKGDGYVIDEHEKFNRNYFQKLNCKQF